MSGLSRRQAALLAALLDADGALVPYAVLGDVIGSSGVEDAKTVRQYVHRIRALGADCVAVVAGRGLRLVALPPDEHLEDVLVMLDAIRREESAMSVLMWRRTA